MTQTATHILVSGKGLHSVTLLTCLITTLPYIFLTILDRFSLFENYTTISPLYLYKPHNYTYNIFQSSGSLPLSQANLQSQVVYFTTTSPNSFSAFLHIFHHFPAVYPL